MGDRELLAIKLALKEWRHWLEGAKHSFVVLTDHKNLKYLQTAKHLNPRQARWALFFTRFQFTISYHPGSKNTKADALSRTHTSEQEEERRATILPEACWINPIEWDIDREIAESNELPPPDSAPSDKVFVPPPLRGKLITWAHTNQASRLG